ncbi:ABC transporter substrate-binding protein [Salipiger mangrovisoli]|uniref:Sugar ABC transporter substrate-binding protein n=1 Tax=Salipiger mangrovisoli TaxID=2865933 RepID=A0ABR9XBI5_9RHOB|nr:sugar ABC transporter substrate-binding protein [Salipiger mangrovisoli]MBE9640852.1 sugar ABC transporter substrate-binding protein [Salipiger mangrovisoli]
MTLNRLAGASLLALALAVPAHAGELTAWVTDAAAEKPYFDQLTDAFSAAHPEIALNVVPVPGYVDAIQAASVSGSLPDLILLDGPNMAASAWAGTIQPIGELIDPALLADTMQGVIAQGTYGPDGKLYHISPYDSTVLLWGNRSYLEKAGVRIPTGIDDAWTREEFAAAVEALSKVDGVRWPLDMKLNYGGEWMTYGFAPFIQSAGADLINRETWTAEGTVNAPEAVSAISKLQDWYKAGWIVPASAGDNQFYGEKTAALSWVGNWMWPPHDAGLGDDLVMMPAPSFGPNGVTTPNGGWGWSVPATTTNLEDVSAFLNFVMSDAEVAKYADITGFAPSRAAAVPLTKKFSTPGAQDLFAVQGNCCAVVRPVHPAYPAITLSWSRAMLNIFSDGAADVQQELDGVAQYIDLDIEDNAGYPPFGSN